MGVRHLAPHPASPLAAPGHAPAGTTATCSRGRQAAILNRAKALTPPRGLCTLSPCDDAARGACDDAPSAHKGDVDDQGRARRPGGHHCRPLEGPDGGRADPVLAGDYGRPAGGGVRGIARLWTLSAPPPRGAGGPESPDRGDPPDSGQSGPHLYGGESLPRARATQRRPDGGRRGRATPGEAVTPRQGVAPRPAGSCTLDNLPGG